MTMADATPTPAPAKKKAAAPKRRAAAPAAAPTARKSSHVVMLSATHDTALGDVVPVTAEQAEALIANGHARAVRPGEVKAAEGK